MLWNFFRKLHEGAKSVGLCPAELDRIKAGEFAEVCLLLEVYAILSNDFGKDSKLVHPSTLSKT